MKTENKEPATKIIDGKVFGYIRLGVDGYPILPDTEMQMVEVRDDLA